MDTRNINIAIIGLGYVGLPLAVEFGKKFKTIGFDINQSRLNDLAKGYDQTLEISSEELNLSKNLTFTANIESISCCNVYIVTVPTPVDKEKQPNLNPLKRASKDIGKVLKKNDIVIYESTVYPGATEEICVPILENESGLIFNNDFFVGYSPERINPGDKNHKLKDILKVTSGSSEDTAMFVDDLYSSIIDAGTFKAASIKVAEAAKVIENTQRDVNIALINELSIIFSKMEIDTLDVLNAAGTKWNFLNFRPGLVGGHCIGVDPYYLTYKSQKLNYEPEIILAGRNLNDSMGSYVALEMIQSMQKKGIDIKKSNILVMGITFKENCPDIRNTKVIDVINCLIDHGAKVDCIDPWVNVEDLKNTYNLNITDSPPKNYYEGIILTTAHDQFINMGSSKIKKYGTDKHVFYDLKSVFSKHDSDLRL